MPQAYDISSKHEAGGLALHKGERNTSEEENIVSMFMEYNPEGEAVTSLGWAQPTGWSSVETGHGVDGLFASTNFPNVLFKVVNGKIKQCTNEGGTFYNVDTGISLTAGNRVLMGEYRGNVYYANGVDAMGRVAVAQLESAVSAAATPWPLKDGSGYRFTNGVDKVYAEGDEADYTAVSTDDLTTVTNGLAHAADTIVTQHKTLTAPPSGSLVAKTFAFFRDTMFYAGPAEPNVLRLSKTVDSVGNVDYVHDFSDGENYLIGEAGDITALKSTRDRLYVFTKDKVYYITVEITSSGTEAFSVDRVFSNNYGCPNPFCVVEMEDVVVFFTGRRLIRIGYDPAGQTLLPDESFDEEIFPLLAGCDYDQSRAKLHYDPAAKKLYVTIVINGILKTIVYNKRMDKYSYSWDHDPSTYVFFKNATYFGDPDDDNIYKFGNDLDGNGTPIGHILQSGRMDSGRRTTKRYIRGMVEGRKTQGTTINFTTLVNGKVVGGVRHITDAHMDATAAAGTIGTVTTGADTIGGNFAGTNLYSYRYPFLIGSVGEDVQVKFSSLEDASFWTVAKWKISGIEYDKTPYTHY